MQYPERFKVGKKIFSIEYEKVLKATSSVRIQKGKVVLRLSRFLHGKKRDETIAKFLKWAEKKLSKVSENVFAEPNYLHGSFINTHNKLYELRISASQTSRNKVKLLDDGLIEVFINNELSGVAKKKKIKELVDKLIIKDQAEYLEEVINELNQLHFQENYNWVRFKRISSRFGSCSSKRNINIAFRLLFAPKEVFRYVCIHELAHLREMNHSKRFWGLVGRAMPNYKDCEKWLRYNGFMLG
jgi:hypothetical protein